MAHLCFASILLGLRLSLAGAASLVSLSAIEQADLSAHTAAYKDFAALDWSNEELSLLQVQVLTQQGRARANQLPELETPGAPASPLTQAITPATQVLAGQKVVWINSFPRSGSSMLLELVEQVDLPVFGLFEPCSPKDNLEPWLAEKGCGAVLSQLAQCDFTGMSWLWGWPSPYTRRNGAQGKYNPETAAKACKSASVVVFKTVSWGHDLASEALPFLEANPQVYMIDLVRDPRSMYGSFLSTWGFANTMPHFNESYLFNWCDRMFQNLHQRHARMQRVVYEKIVESPFKTANDMFAFLGIPGESHVSQVSSYLKDNFNGENCNDKDFYSNCRSNSSANAERYRTIPNETAALFMNNIHCRHVALTYGYDPYYPFPDPHAR